MQAIKINERVIGHHDIIIPFEKIKAFQNEEVEIIVFSTKEENRRPNKEKFLSYAGTIKTEPNDTGRRVDEIIYGK